MPPAPPTSRLKWRRERFWAFVLLGLNRVLNHDFVPPWGFEFLVRVNVQAWWYYAQYEFDARYGMPGQDGREQSSRNGDEKTLDDEDGPASTERSWSFSSGRQVHCSMCCAGGCGDVDLCYLQCSCRNEQIKTESLLPRFDWEGIDLGQDFDDLFQVSLSETSCPVCCI